ncbi:unnamed protein product [Caenorhabditis sp. 36 PRJEB53466]|nr:unnamed protein product [Caenorhabditis sp. 36 PRJEB53466]
MSYYYEGVWNSSNFSSDSNTDNWRPTNHAYSQHEQYNPVYPSFSGTADFLASSALQEPAPYNPTKRSTSARETQNRPGNSIRRGGSHQKRNKKTWKAKRFHLITLSTDPQGNADSTDFSKIQEASPKTVVTVAPRNNKSRGGKGIQKMPNYSGSQVNNWESNGFQQPRGSFGRPPHRGGRGRGGGGGRGGRFNGALKPTNSKDDIQFVALPDDAPAITLAVSSDNILAFHGFDSVFTTQHSFPVLIDKKIYASCDHYYQICKVTDLTGVSSDKLNKAVRDQNGKPIVESSGVEKEKKAFSAIAKDIIRASNISKEKVDEWRNTKGLEAIQKGLHAKVAQSAHLREALKESGDRILVHAFVRDSIYGTGSNVLQVKKWLDDLLKAGVKTLRIPSEYPLDDTTVQHCPVFAQGRNILGVILMQLREMIRKEEIEIVDMSKIYDALRVNDTEAMDVTPTGAGFIMDNSSVGTF